MQQAVRGDARRIPIKQTASRNRSLNGVYGATKAYVLALSRSLQHELANKGLRIPAVLLGATATEI
jgi:short-subunit dehydrogenase